MWIAAAIILIVALGATVTVISRTVPPPKVVNSTQITNDGIPKTRALTDGSRIYITETMGMKSVLAQVSTTGGDTSLIPTPFTSIVMSDISPDRSRLLVADNVGTERQDQAWILPLPTGSPKRLGEVVANWAVWSRDGRQVAFCRESDIYMARGDGTEAHKLISISGFPSELRFSPDGSRLRFTISAADNANVQSIWELRTDGTGLHPLLPGWRNPPSECCGLWSEDGRYYFFLDVASNTSNVWALRERSGFFHRHRQAPTQLTTGPMSIGFVTPSPDGKKLFADAYQPRPQLIRYDNNSHQFVPFLSGISAAEVDFSRDGKWVTYVTYPGATLWRSRVDGSDRLQLTDTPVVAFLPRWSPDGTQIAFDDMQAGRPWRACVISAGGGTAQQILSEKRTRWTLAGLPMGNASSLAAFHFYPELPTKSRS
jgi:Tol biopolymer transport system component